MDDYETERLKEILETLAGERKRAMPQAAVRLVDLNGILALPVRLQSTKAVGSTPSKAEYDALCEDLHTLHRGLLAVMSAMRDRQL